MDFSDRPARALFNLSRTPELVSGKANHANVTAAETHRNTTAMNLANLMKYLKRLREDNTIPEEATI
ncbi:hypothetical protein GCM10009096_02240 [Parasphingorhabdus litoris]|uniref:Uncharacterized protein n=1 Tax=Parasphingorhabdus litoris TaxID=394733 RepID=A0ABP3JVS0_9SPHN